MPKSSISKSAGTPSSFSASLNAKSRFLKSKHIEDIKLYIDFIKKNNLKNHEIIIIPDTQQDVPKEIMEIIKNENLKYHLFHHGSFSIPMRFLAYSNASFNLASTNGPLAMLWFIKNDAFFILKDSNQGEDVKNFVDKFNKNIFLDRKFYFHKRY